VQKQAMNTKSSQSTQFDPILAVLADEADPKTNTDQRQQTVE
jgi:hypothetical protein